MKFRHFLLCSLSLLFFSCLKAPKTAKSCPIVNNTEDFFTIQDNTDSPGRAYNVFCKKVNVFGVYVYGTCKVEDSDLLRAANILAQYLDNDEDGLVDNPLVLQKMIENKAAMAMFGKENSSFKRRFFRTNEGNYTPESAQDLYDLDLWVVDCVRYEPHYSHSHFDQTISWINKYKPKKAILTHLGAWLDYKDLLSKCPANVAMFMH